MATAANRNFVLTQFVLEAVLSEHKSEKASRPIFDDVECIRIVVPGSRDEVFRVATDEDRRRFPKEYEAFKRAGDEVQHGTPLGQWTYANPAFVREMNFNNVFTVEQLAELPDAVAMQLGMGMLEKRDLARAWLAKASGDEAAVARIQDENADLKAKLDAQAAEIAAMRQLLEEATKPKRRGRPPKAADLDAGAEAVDGEDDDTE